MAKSVAAPVNPEVLSWAREIAGLTPEAAAKKVSVKPERLVSWELGDARPTIIQVGNLARVYGRTPALFFLSEPPKPDLPRPPDFRRADPHRQDMSFELRRQLRDVVERRETLIDLERDAVPFALADLGTLEPDVAAARVRDRLGVTVDDQLGQPNPYAMFNRWVAALEPFGVLTFQSSDFDIDEARGVSIWFQDWSVVLINGKDDIKARCFTLFHEVGHLVRGSSSLCGLEEDVREERHCNRLAAAVLMPANALLKMVSAQPIDHVNKLASRFKVSPLAMAIRMSHLGLLSDSDVALFRTNPASFPERDASRSGGPPFHTVRLRDLGRRYAGAVLDAYDRGDLLLDDVSYFLGAKLPQVEKIRVSLRTGQGS